MSSKPVAEEPSYVATIHSFLTLFRYLRRYSRQAHESGQSGRRLSTLRYLHDAGPQTMGQLSDYLYINESSTTELIAKLEEAGLAERSRSRTDNRIVEVAITPAGREIAATVGLGGIPLLRERLKSLPREELEAIGAVFRKLNRLLEIEEEP